MTRPIARPLGLAFAVALGLTLAGCEGLSSMLDAGPPNPKARVQLTEPRFQAGDKLKVVVFDEDRMSGEYEVDAGGAISLPLAGSVRAAGLTKSELEGSLVQMLRAKQLLQTPKVTVDIASLRPFYVLGEVEKPGEYPYRSGLNVMSAVAMAGGDTFRASKSKVQIQRAGDQGFTEAPFAPDVPIYPGDLINIPERYF